MSILDRKKKEGRPVEVELSRMVATTPIAPTTLWDRIKYWYNNRKNKKDIGLLYEAFANCEIVIGDTHNQICTEINDLKQKNSWLQHHKLREDYQYLRHIALCFAKYVETCSLDKRVNNDGSFKSLEETWESFKIENENLRNYRTEEFSLAGL